MYSVEALSHELLNVYPTRLFTQGIDNDPPFWLLFFEPPFFK